MNRRNLLKAASAIAITGLTTALPRQTTYAHKKEAMRELHLYAGENYFRWEFKGSDGKTVKVDKNGAMKLKVGEILLLTAHCEGKFTHSIHVGRKPKLDEQRFEEAPFEPFLAFTTLEPKGFAEIELLVPEKAIGEWELGDFSLKSAGGPTFYAEGMKAPLVVEK